MRTTATTNRKLAQAVECFTRRKNRDEHPDGEFDNAGRWYPADNEKCDCCDPIRSPSRAYPYSLMVHCRTAQHVAALFGVSASELRAATRHAQPPIPIETAYKIVERNGSLKSVYDSDVVYTLGKWMIEAVRPNHGGGYYCYETAEQAIAAARENKIFGDRLADGKMLVLCKCSVRGRAERYGANDEKIARSYLRVDEIIGEVKKA